MTSTLNNAITGWIEKLTPNHKMSYSISNEVFILEMKFRSLSTLFHLRNHECHIYYAIHTDQSTSQHNSHAFQFQLDFSSKNLKMHLLKFFFFKMSNWSTIQKICSLHNIASSCCIVYNKIMLKIKILNAN